MPLSTTASQVWAILARHARDEIGPLRLQELCLDQDRVSSLLHVHTFMESAADRSSHTPIAFHTAGGASSQNNRIMIVDLSRQRMTLETIHHLLQLAIAFDVPGFIRTLAWGQNDPNDPIRIDNLDEQVQKHKHVSVAQTTRNSVLYGDIDEEDDTRPLTLKTSPSMHMALRVPAHAGLCMYTADGKNALDEIHTEWARMERLSTSIRKGLYRGAAGHILKNVVLVGRGVSIAAVRFIYDVLQRDEEGAWALSDGITSDITEKIGLASSSRGLAGGWGTSTRTLRFITCIDPVAAASTVADLLPGSTLIVTVALKGDDDMEMVAVQDFLKKWLLYDLLNHAKPESILNKHIITITGNQRVYKLSKPETTFLIPVHSRSEAFSSLTSAGLLPLSIVFGWNICQQILNGAHDMDTHFIETNAPHNIPVLLALTDIWNDAFLGSSGRILQPFTKSFESYPDLIANIESQVYGRALRRRNNAHGKIGMPSVYAAATVIDGGLRGTYDRVCFQGGRMIASELVLTMDSQALSSNVVSKLFGADGNSDAVSNHDSLICSFFAHADVLAFGSSGLARKSVRENAGGILHIQGTGPEMLQTGSFDDNSSPHHDNEFSDGNRPSTLLVLGRCDAFACGQLLAMAEHRAVVAARCWGVENPFSFSQSNGTSVRSRQTELMKEKLFVILQKLALGQGEDDDEAMALAGPRVSIATSTILANYASRMSNLNGQT